MSKVAMSELALSLVPGTFSPSPGPASRRQMVFAQTAVEIRILLRNGEQLTLTLVIPLLLLAVFTLENLVNLNTGLSDAGRSQKSSPSSGSHPKMPPC